MPPSPPPVAEKELVYDISWLPLDQVERPPIANYPINDQDAVRQSYIIKAHSNFMHMNSKVEESQIGVNDSILYGLNL